MVQKTAAVSPSFRRFLKRVIRSLDPERIVLFGNRACWTHRSTSDHDLRIVARRFRGIPWVERAPMAPRS